VLALRPKTLTAAVVPVLVGTALAVAHARAARPWLAVFAVASALCIQIATNLINDALDFRKGADTPERIGPQRVTASGLLRPGQVLWGAAFVLALAVALGIPLVIAGGWPIGAIGVASVVFAWAYTGGPYPLAYVGLGDLFVLLFFGLVAVAGTVWLVAQAWLPGTALAGAQIGLLAVTLIAINNLRDREGDAAVGKRTLAVRLGVRGAKLELAAVTLAPFLGGIGWWWLGLRLAATLPLISLVLALKLVRDVLRSPPSPAYNGFLARAARLHLAFGALLAAGLFAAGRVPWSSVIP
jgi:1,4-dihydroxy-2-naphthoate octaprenyltransferase